MCAPSTAFSAESAVFCLVSCTLCPQIAAREFEELRTFLASHNEALVEEARRKHAEAVAAAQAEFEAQCEELRAAHEAELARVRAHNEAIWPQVGSCHGLHSLHTWIQI